MVSVASGGGVHATAVAGYARAGDDYERARPDYPAEVLDALCVELGLGPASVVVELGAGTGKFTRLLAPRVATVVATEPVGAMRAHLAAVASPVVAATAEALPLAGCSVDAVVAATAFHWFRAGAALAEARRLLRPGGGLGLAWNNPDRDADWVARVWAVVDEARGSVPGNRDLRWREAFGPRCGFSPLRHRRFSHVVTLTHDQLLARVSSISFIAALGHDDRRALLGRVGAIVDAHPDLAGSASVPLPYRCDLYWCHRAPDGARR